MWHYRRRVTGVPLRRNRDFMLLQIGQLLSDAGSQSTSIAYESASGFSRTWPAT